VNALCEQPTNGDLYALCGDSKIHVLRPAAAKQAMADPADAILPQKFVHSDLLINAFYIRMSLSPDSKYLACGSQSGGVMAWDTSVASPEVVATRLRIPSLGPNVDDMPDVVAVDWAKDMVSQVLVSSSIGPFYQY
jgi:denticleless